MKVLSLFSGIGGFDLAAERLGHEIIGACEIDKYARQVYARHFPNVPIHEDATKINPEELPDFDLLCAGFPCQAFSIAGKRLGFEESRGTLFFEIARVAKQKRPRLLLLENVKGLLSHDGGRTFAEILATLDDLGYDAQWQVLNSKYFVPQNRERIFIIGHLRGEPRPKVFPVGAGSQVDYSARQETQGEGERISSQHSSSLQTSPGKGNATYVNTIDANYHKGGSRTMIYMPQKNPNRSRDIGYNNGYYKIDSHKEPEIKYHNKSESQYKRIYETDGIAPALGVGHAMQSPNIKDYFERTPDTLGRMMPVHRTSKHKIRRLTPLECERLQGFPDGYTDGISDTQRYKCLGNAVTVPVVEYIISKLN